MTQNSPDADHELGMLFPQTEEELLQFHIAETESPEPSKAEIESNSSAILKKLGHGVSIAVACAYCKGALQPGLSCYCASCLAPHHEDCFRDYGRCSSCKELEFVRPKKSEAIELRPRARRRSSGFFLGIVIGSVSVAAALTLNVQWQGKPQVKDPSQTVLTARQKSQLILLQAREKQRHGADAKIVHELIESALEGSPRDPDLLLEASEVYMSASSFDRAKPLLEEAVKKNPESYGALFHLHCIDQRKTPDLSAKMTSWLTQLLATARKNKAENQYTLFAEAVENQTSGRWKTALGLYRRLDLNDLCVVTNTASCYQQLGQYNAAIDTLNTAISIEWQPQFVARRAYLNYSIGDNEKALQDCKTVLQKDPKDQKFLTLKGDVLRKLGRNDEALGEYSQLIRQNPQDADAYLKRGDVYYSLKRFAEAHADYSRAIQLNPKLSKAFYHRGLCAREMGRLMEAKNDFDMTLRLNPNDRSCRMARVELYLQEGEQEKALGSLRWLSQGKDRVANKARRMLVDVKTRTKKK